MHVHYVGHGSPDTQLRRLVEHRAGALAAGLARLGVAPDELRVSVRYDVRADAYDVTLALHIADTRIAGHGAEVMRSAAVVSAYRDLCAAVERYAAARTGAGDTPTG